MSTAGEPVRTPEELRVMAEELSRGADRCTDPEHRARLRRKAKELRAQFDGDDLHAPNRPVHDPRGRDPRGTDPRGTGPRSHGPHNAGPRDTPDRRPERKRGA